MKPEAAPTARRHPAVSWAGVAIAGVLAAGALATAVHGAEGTLRPATPRGLTHDVDEVPPPYRGGWQATVLVSQQALVGVGNARFRPETVGSGVVLSVRREGRRRVALVATNDHVLRCTKVRCWTWVAFAREGSSRPTLISRKVDTLWRDPGRDLAFLEVRLPRGLDPGVATLADGSCRRHVSDGVVAVGWPDMTSRSEWEDGEPRGAHLRLKRFSAGRLVAGDLPEVVRRALGWDDGVQIFLHTADLLPGCSGGPVLDAEGHVLGLNTALAHGPSVDDPYNRPCTDRATTGGGHHCAYVAIAASEIAAAFEQAVLETDSGPD